MSINRWWANRPDEIYWMETTDRDQLGIDLAAPQLDDAGHQHAGYALIREVRAGDVVFHYHKHNKAIVAWSRATGSFWEEDIVWGAHGTVARGAGVRPYNRPGYRHGLDGPYWLAEPVTLSEIRASEENLRIALEIGSEEVHGPLYFPFEVSSRRPPRPTQFYLTKFPRILAEMFPQLALAQHISREPRDSVQVIPLDVGISYRSADENAATSERDPFEVDPNVVDRSLRAHARLQNEVASWAAKRGHQPVSPGPRDPKFDVAWLDGDQLWVVEIKSLTHDNEELQLRLGLGQILRYKNLLLRRFHSVIGALAVERKPSDPAWPNLCESLGIAFLWPGTAGGLEFFGFEDAS